jgi:hypothetical protein
MCCPPPLSTNFGVVSDYQTIEFGYQLILATDNSVAKFSNGFATDCIFINFLILATDFSNGKSVAKNNIKFATDYPLLIEKINI